MVDEYQDSNLVQETLIKAISKEKRGAAQRFYGRRCKTEHLPIPPGQTGFVLRKI